MNDARWSPPAVGMIALTVDSAFNPTTGDAGLGVIIREHSGQLLLMAWRMLFHCRDAEEAEAATCLDGIRLACKCPDKGFVLESNCAIVVQILRTATRDRSSITGLIEDTCSEGRQRTVLSVAKIQRKQNKIAHELAQMTCRLKESRVSCSHVPVCIRGLMLAVL